MSNHTDATEDVGDRRQHVDEIMTRIDDIGEGDYVALIPEIVKLSQFGECGEDLYQQMLRIVSTDTLVQYVRSMLPESYGLFSVLSFCIDHYIMLDYPRITLEIARTRLRGDGAFFEMCKQGASYLVSPNVMLAALGKKPNKECVDMLRIYLETRGEPTCQKRVLVIMACSQLGISQEDLHEMIDSEGAYSVLAYAIRERKNVVIPQLLFSGECLKNEADLKDALEYAEELENTEAAEILENFG